PQVDLILCRECLYHLSFADIYAAISNFKQSGSKYLLATHVAGIRRNIDILTGGCRLLNWTLSPFHFTEPIASLAESRSAHSLALWRFDDIKVENFDPL